MREHVGFLLSDTMGNHEDVSDPDSEFNSEAEDAEFQLYQQLYFEPNSSIITTDDTCGMERKDGKENTHQTGRGHFPSKNVPIMTSLIPPDKHVTIEHDFQSNQKSHFESCIFIDMPEGSELSLSQFSSDFRVPDAQNDSCIQLTEQPPSTVAQVSVSDDCVKRQAVPSQSLRKRITSTCSDGSIPGSIPLDGLYCNIVTSDEDDEDDNIKEKLLMKDLSTNNHGNHKESIPAEHAKRKRINSSSSDDDMEDSRCNKLISVASKKYSESFHLIEDSNSEEDIYVLPPPVAINPEILTLDSSGGSEPEALNEEQNRVRKPNNKYQKVENGNKALRKQRIKVGRKSRRRNKDLCGSETEDSNDVDFPEATKGTDLTLNIDSSLSGLVKTITKDPTVKTSSKFSKAKKSPKKQQGRSNQSSLDFSRGRPDTQTKPSCEKWTQSMANFYDTDISDEFDVSEVHEQQSESRANWPLIAADYHIIQRRRYYNAAERCKICRQEGHATKACTLVPKCHLCSGTDHTGRNRCPGNCCFKCGEEPHFFCPKTDRSRICGLCGYPGHSKELCPDLWRRYHVTTTGMVAQPPLESYPKPPRERYCYVCAMRGHYGHECPKKYNNISYAQVPQSVVSYSSPVKLVKGYLAVNTDGAQEPLPEENVTKMLIKLDHSGRIIGKKGVVVKAIMKESGAQVRVMTHGQPQVLLFGSSEARLKAQEIIEVLLRQKNLDRYADFVEHLRTINRFDALENQGKSKRPSSTQAAGITSSIPKSCCSSSQVSTNNTIGASVPTVRDSESSAVIASTSGGTTTNVKESKESNNWCAKFLNNLNRDKEIVLKQIKIVMSTLANNTDSRKVAASVNDLKMFRSKKQKKPNLKLKKPIKTHMKRILLSTISKGKHEEGIRLYSEVKTLMQDVEKCPSNVIPENICVKIAKTLECLHVPSVEQIDKLIEYGDIYISQTMKPHTLNKMMHQQKNLELNNVKSNKSIKNMENKKEMYRQNKKRKRQKKQKNSQNNNNKTNAEVKMTIEAPVYSCNAVEYV